MKVKIIATAITIALLIGACSPQAKYLRKQERINKKAHRNLTQSYRNDYMKSSLFIEMVPLYLKNMHKD